MTQLDPIRSLVLIEGGSYLSAEMQIAYFTVLTNWAGEFRVSHFWVILYA